MSFQPSLFMSQDKQTKLRSREMRVFANDEIVNALKYLPDVNNYNSYAEYKDYLERKLPYNSVETRRRRTNYILDRFYPDETLDSALTVFTKRNNSPETLKPIVFYHLAKAELLLAKTADEFIYPALPKGKIEREQLREFVLSYLPNIGASSQKNALRSIFYSYSLLGLGREEGDNLKFQLRSGDLDAFVYILLAEFPEPGIYTFDKLFDGPAHRWLLWDKEWLRTQLYYLRDLKVISKISEIDTIRQFSLEFGQMENLQHYFESLSNNPDKKQGDGL